MDFAAVSFTLIYKHSRQDLEVYIDKLQLRPYALNTMPWLANSALSIHATLLPVKKRFKTRERRRRMADLYFVYDQYFTVSNVKSADVGSMGLRLRLYLTQTGTSACKGHLRLADACLTLRGMSLTSEVTEFVLVLTDDCCDYSVKLFIDREEGLHKSKIRNRPRKREVRSSMIDSYLDSEPKVAVQLNYDAINHHIVIHLQRATNLVTFNRKHVIFQVLVLLPDRRIIYKAETKRIATDSVNILHQAFEIPVTPRQCREVTVVIQLLTQATNSKKKSKNMFPIGHLSFGRCSSGQLEREQFLQAFKDEFPTEMISYPLRKMGFMIVG